MGHEEVIAEVAEMLCRRSNGALTSVAGPDRLEDLGLDSIDIVYILSTYERNHDTSFDDVEFDPRRYETVADLALAIAKRIDA